MSAYPSFSDLPLELREEIWRFAIPSRVAEVGIPVWERFNIFGCAMRHTSRQNAMLPTIASVCHEAYQVARKHGRCLKDCYPIQSWTLPNYHRYHGQTIDIPLWNPTLDTLHLNWEPYFQDFHNYSNQFDELRALLARMPTKRSISLPAHPFHSPGSEDGAVSEEILCLTPGRDYFAVLHVICVHASRKDVIDSGLFEKGESPVVLVDILDVSTMSAYAELLSLFLPGIRCESVDFLGDLLSSEILPSAIDTWKCELEKLWVWSRWCESRSQHPVDHYGLSTQYYDRKEHGKRTWPFASKAPRKRTTFDDRQELFQHDLNLNDPWVAAEVERAPKLSPVIMFRLCEDECPVTQDLTNRCIRQGHRRLWDIQRSRDVPSNLCECGHTRRSLGRNYEPGAAKRLRSGHIDWQGYHWLNDSETLDVHRDMLRMRDMLKYGHIREENRTA